MSIDNLCVIWTRSWWLSHIDIATTLFEITVLSTCTIGTGIELGYRGTTTTRTIMTRFRRHGGFQSVEGIGSGCGRGGGVIVAVGNVVEFPFTFW